MRQFLCSFLGIILCINPLLAEDTAATLPQTKTLPTERMSVKLNGLLAIGVINPAIEFPVHKNISIQMEGMGVFYNRDFLGTGVPLVLATTFLEGRYYFKEVFQKFYAGPNIGWGVWKMNKDIAPGYSYGHSTNQYGNNVMMGLTLGYQWAVSQHWSIDFSWGLGWQHAIYEGFQDSDGDGVWESYFDTSIPKGALNQSAEWMPAYKGGVFVSYRF